MSSPPSEFSFWKSAELVFFPSFCKLCGVLLERRGERVVCAGCLEKLRPRRSSFCISCGRFFEEPGEPHLCSHCLEQRPHFSHHRSCGLYQGLLKDLILLFKYHNYKVLGKKLGAYAFLSLGREEALWWKTDLLMPVPLHPKKRKQRGFNQSLILAKELSRKKRIPLVKNVLVKTKPTPPQTSLEADDRRANVKGAFGVRRAARIEGKIVLLVDDVYTTGATISECSRVILEAGAKDVRALTLARA